MTTQVAVFLVSFIGSGCSFWFGHVMGRRHERALWRIWAGKDSPREAAPWLRREG